MSLGATSYMRNDPAFLSNHSEDLVTHEEVVPRVHAWLCLDLSFPFVVKHFYFLLHDIYLFLPLCFQESQVGERKA
jgi:hypothetical protein